MASVISQSLVGPFPGKDRGTSLQYPGLLTFREHPLDAYTPFANRLINTTIPPDTNLKQSNTPNVYLRCLTFPWKRKDME